MLGLTYLRNVMKHLNIKRSNDYAVALYESDIHRWDRHVMSGGYKSIVEESEKEPIKQRFLGEEYEITHVVETDRDYFRVMTDEDEACLILIKDNTGLVDIQSLSNYKGHIKNSATIGTGTFILRLAIHFFKANKTELGFKKLVLQDNSSKYCRQSDPIYLSDMYFLINGNTWYGHYGFVPYDSNENTINKTRAKDYILYQKMMKTTTLEDISDNLKKMVRKAYHSCYPSKKLPPIKLDKIIDYIDKHQSQPLHEFVKSFLSDYDNSCFLFSKFYKELMLVLNMVSFHGEAFCLDEMFSQTYFCDNLDYDKYK